MTNESLEEMISRYNAKDFPSYVAFRVLSDTVVLGRVWLSEPTGAVLNESSYKFYFILQCETCVGVVYDMQNFEIYGCDLHWLIAKEHRGNGYLFDALHRIILPHLFADGREEQFVTAQGESAIRYARRQGFKNADESDESTCNEMRLRITKQDIDVSAVVEGANRKLTDDDLREFKERLRTAKALVRSVEEAVILATTEDRLFLGELVEMLEDAASSVADKYP